MQSTLPNNGGRKLSDGVGMVMAGHGGSAVA